MKKLGLLVALLSSAAAWGQGEITGTIRDAVKRPDGPTARVLARYEPATAAQKRDAKGNIIEDDRALGHSLFVVEIPAVQILNRYTLTPQILASSKTGEPLIYDSTGLELNASLPAPEALKSLDIAYSHYIPGKKSDNTNYELRTYAILQRGKAELNAQPYVSGDYKGMPQNSGMGMDINAEYRLERPFTTGIRSYLFVSSEENEAVVGPSLNLKMDKVSAYVTGGYDFARGDDNLFARLQLLLEL